MNRANAVDQLKRVFTVLIKDVDEAVAYGRTNPSPFTHRTLVRTHFALVEGLAYRLRQVTLASLEGTELLTLVEVAVLKEERYALNAKGHPVNAKGYEPWSFGTAVSCGDTHANRAVRQPGS